MMVKYEAGKKKAVAEQQLSKLRVWLKRVPFYTGFMFTDMIDVGIFEKHTKVHPMKWRYYSLMNQLS